MSARARQLAQGVLMNQRVRVLLGEVVESGACDTEAEALERAIETLDVAVVPPRRRHRHALAPAAKP